MHITSINVYGRVNVCSRPMMHDFASPIFQCPFLKICGRGEGGGRATGKSQGPIGMLTHRRSCHPRPLPLPPSSADQAKSKRHCFFHPQTKFDPKYQLGITGGVSEKKIDIEINPNPPL